MSDIILKTGNAAGVPLSIPMGGDMSAPRTSDRVYIGKPGKYGVTVSWPATPVGGTDPTGAWAIQENGGESDATWDTIAACSDADFIAAKPAGAGTAGGFTVKNIETTSPYVRVVYTAVSGGVDVVPTVEMF